MTEHVPVEYTEVDAINMAKSVGVEPQPWQVPRLVRLLNTTGKVHAPYSSRRREAKNAAYLYLMYGRRISDDRDD